MWILVSLADNSVVIFHSGREIGILFPLYFPTDAWKPELNTDLES